MCPRYPWVYLDSIQVDVKIGVLSLLTFLRALSAIGHATPGVEKPGIKLVAE